MVQIIYLFTSPPLFSPFLCLPGLVPQVWKGGQLGGNGKKTRQSFILDSGMKTTGVIQFSYAIRSGATHSKLLQVMCCRIVTIFQTCCEIASSSLIISGSRCLLRQWPYNERVWLQQGAAEMWEGGNVACWESELMWGQEVQFSVTTVGSLKFKTPFSNLYLRWRARRQEGHLNELHVAFTACERMCRPSILPQWWGMWGVDGRLTKPQSGLNILGVMWPALWITDVSVSWLLVVQSAHGHCSLFFSLHPLCTENNMWIPSAVQRITFPQVRIPLCIFLLLI